MQVFVISTPSSGIPVPPEPRWLSAGAFAATGGLAIAFALVLVRGAVPAPAAEGGWLAAYLFLIAGVAQIVLGAGQAWVAAAPPPFEWVAIEWGALNLGNVGIVAGSLLGSFWIVLAGTAAFVCALALFAFGVRRSDRAAWRIAYAVVLVFLPAMAVVGLALALAQFQA